jgi:hypothetical protein
MTMTKIDFAKAFDECVSADKRTHKEEYDARFGEGGDVIALIGTAGSGSEIIAVARMVSSEEIASLPNHIFVKEDGNTIMFWAEDILLLAAELDGLVEGFKAVAQKNGWFVFEGITPHNMHKAVVDLSGNVLETTTFPISTDEYEKHLAGFYCAENMPTSSIPKHGMSN